jgi:DNA-binding transcriptional ArsR family regulator
MAQGTDEDAEETLLSPGEAFAAIGHETRVQILEALATAHRSERPLSFSALRERVGAVDSSRFNYHLDQLVGHFLERSEDGYGLSSAGERMAEAIQSGAVTEDPLRERVQLEESCHYCGAPIEVSYRRERVELYCTECPGTYGTSNTQEAGEGDIPAEYGFLGLLNLPPAGLQDRTPSGILQSALSWHVTEALLSADGTCPRCSARMDAHVTLCEDHDHAGGTCTDCENRYAAQHSAHCTNCVYSRRVFFGASLLSNTALQAFLTEHDRNLVAPEFDRYASVMMDYEERILGTDPFEATFTFTADGDAITVTVDDDLDVVDVARRDAADD